MAYRKITELNDALGALQDGDFIEGHPLASTESKKYTGEQVRAVEKAEREAQDDVIEASVGLSEDGEFIPYSGTEYLDGATSIADAIELLDTAMGGDFMQKSVYDPNGMKSNAFDMDNMVEGIFHKILTEAPQDINGVKTFLSQPKFAGEPVAPEDLVNLEYLEDNFGDMKKATYDPTGVSADAFDMDNMVEGVTNKILTKDPQEILGVKTFNEFPKTPQTDPASDWEVTNKRYVDSVALGIKGSSSASISSAVASSGTVPSVTNTDKYVEIELGDVDTPSSISLGSMSAKIYWEGTMAAYQAIPTKDSNTLYYIYE